MEDVLKIVDGWDPRCAAILSKAPSVVDWKVGIFFIRLVERDLTLSLPARLPRSSEDLDLTQGALLPHWRCRCTFALPIRLDPSY